MKFHIVSCLLMSLAVSLSLALEMKSVLISFPDNTPEDVMAQIRDALSEVGSSITDEFSTINGFAVDVPTVVIGQLRAAIARFGGDLEDNGPVSIMPVSVS